MKFWTLVLLLFVGCKGAIDPLEPQPVYPLRANTYIENLQQGVVRGEIVVQGSVTTSDSCGNFYQSMMLQDATGAIELRFGFYDVYSLFRRGEVVSVRLFDKQLSYQNGIISASMGSFSVASQNVLRQGYFDSIIPKRVLISQIDSTLLGQYVEIVGGEFDNGGKVTWSGEQRYSVGKERIVVYTTPFATFANKILPIERVTLRGIVTIYKGEFQLKISSLADCSI